MASEEERAKIMAEFLAGNADDDADEEDEFHSEDDDDDDDEGAAATAPANHPVLRGRFKLDGESRLVYLGTWHMKQNPVFSKETKFKLKSTECLPKFNLGKPTVNKPFKFDGFFCTDATDKVQPYRKIKERNVEITFSKHGNKSYSVTGRGTNDFGTFALKGIYMPDAARLFAFQCDKAYGGFAADGSSDEDSEDDEADPGELSELQGDADLSIDDLKKKYCADNETGEEGKPPAKKQKK